MALKSFVNGWQHASDIWEGSWMNRRYNKLVIFKWGNFIEEITLKKLNWAGHAWHNIGTLIHRIQ